MSDEEVESSPLLGTNKQNLKLKNDVSSIAFELFSDWQNFASTPCGFLFTVGTVILGVVAFIVLSQYNMAFIGAMTFAGAVFGDLVVGLVAGKLHKNGFFRCCSPDTLDLSTEKPLGLNNSN